ncbi:MAG: hypothetical protein LBF58_12830 [Deltaproteobacteria bacterium]|jgi:hypothetical protein|nr:hypothetical protein [Deltaproteobacteria bacterium]
MPPVPRNGALAIAVALSLALAAPAWAQGGFGPGQGDLARLERRLDSVKREFEDQLGGLADHRQISALALRAAGEAWMEAAAQADPPGELFDPVELIGDFEKGWEESERSWAEREARALRFYFVALARLAARLAVRSGDKETAANLAGLLKAARSGQKRPRPLTAQAVEAEAKVFWSNRLCALAAILGHLGDDKAQRQGVADLVEDLLNRSEVVARRTDIHYQAKMELLYLNNAQSVTRVLFLLAKDGPPNVADRAMAMERAWDNHMTKNDLRVADRVSLTWVANAQLAFPLAWWLASGEGP